jgi:hypothetical protein
MLAEHSINMGNHVLLWDISVLVKQFGQMDQITGEATETNLNPNSIIRKDPWRGHENVSFTSWIKERTVFLRTSIDKSFLYPWSL